MCLCQLQAWLSNLQGRFAQINGQKVKLKLCSDCLEQKRPSVVSVAAVLLTCGGLTVAAVKSHAVVLESDSVIHEAHINAV